MKKGLIIICISVLLTSCSKNVVKVDGKRYWCDENVYNWFYQPDIVNEYTKTDPQQFFEPIRQGSQYTILASYRRNGTLLLNRFALNLFTDEYFIPFYNSRFDELSAKDRKSLFDKINNCDNDLISSNYKDIFEIYLLQRHQSAETSIKKFRTLRKTKVKILSHSDDKLVSSEIVREINYLKKESVLYLASDPRYWTPLLLPSEIEYLGTKPDDLLRKYEKDQRIRSITIEVDEIITLSPTPENIRELIRYKRLELHPLRFELGMNSVNALIAKIDNRIDSILQNWAINDLSAVQEWEFVNFESLTKRNDEWKNIIAKYPTDISIESFNNLNTAYRNKRTQFLMSRKQIISDYINSAKSIGSLDYLKQEIFVDIDNTPIIEELRSFMNYKRLELELAQKFESEKREALIRGTAEFAAKERIRLTNKYSTHFPTLDELFEINNLALPITKRFYKSDEELLINYLDNIGYSVKTNTLVKNTVLHEFINNQNYVISTYLTQNSSGIIEHMWTTFKIDNPDHDIIKMYLSDITSSSRPIFSNYKTPWTDSDSLNLESPFVKSGGTTYSASFKDGEFQITVRNNNLEKFDVMAESVEENTIKVTPWSTITHIYLSKNDRIEYSVSGTITLGAIRYPVGPSCIDGFRNFNIFNNANHGSLIGRIGDGLWFLVGKSGVITATEEGRLELRVNDKKNDDNDGFFNFQFKFNY